MNTKFQNLFVLATVFGITFTNLCFPSNTYAQDPPAWSWSVPTTHPFYGKSSHELMQSQRPVYHIDGGIHENAYIFADYDGYAVMVVGPRVEYVDFDEFNRQHQVIDSGETPENPDLAGWAKFENIYTGRQVKIHEWLPSPVPRPQW